MMTKAWRLTDDYEGVNFFEPETDPFEKTQNLDCDHIYAFQGTASPDSSKYRCVKCGKVRYHKI